MTGRPTKYNDEIVHKAYDYIDNYEQYGDVIPSHAGMAVELNLHKSTLYDWADDPDKAFSDILAKCNARQERVLMRNGLNGEFNSNIAKLALGKHGYSEKTENDSHHTFDFSNMSEEELKRIVGDT